MDLTHMQQLSTETTVVLVLLYILLKMIMHFTSSEVTEKVHNAEGELVGTKTTEKEGVDFSWLPFATGVGIVFSVIWTLQTFGVLR